MKTVSSCFTWITNKCDATSCEDSCMNRIPATQCPKCGATFPTAEECCCEEIEESDDPYPEVYEIIPGDTYEEMCLEGHFEHHRTGGLVETDETSF